MTRLTRGVDRTVPDSIRNRPPAGPGSDSATQCGVAGPTLGFNKFPQEARDYAQGQAPAPSTGEDPAVKAMLQPMLPEQDAARARLNRVLFHIAPEDQAATIEQAAPIQQAAPVHAQPPVARAQRRVEAVLQQLWESVKPEEAAKAAVPKEQLEQIWDEAQADAARKIDSARALAPEPEPQKLKEQPVTQTAETQTQAATLPPFDLKKELVDMIRLMRKRSDFNLRSFEPHVAKDWADHCRQMLRSAGLPEDSHLYCDLDHAFDATRDVNAVDGPFRASNFRTVELYWILEALYKVVFHNTVPADL
jgi:hypothetical protein